MVVQPYIKANVGLRYGDSSVYGFSYDYWGEAGLRLNTLKHFSLLVNSRIRFFEDRFEDYYFEHNVSSQVNFHLNFGIRLEASMSKYDEYVKATLVYYQ